VSDEGFRFQPWAHQRPALKAMDENRNTVLVWHRKAGKDLTLFNACLTKAYKRPGSYYYLFPTYSQGKKIFWDGMDYEGTPYLHYVPKSIFLDKDETDMQLVIRTHNKKHSIIQVVGTDNLNRIVGPNPIGAVYSEYSVQNPRAKMFLDPIFAANKGWQAFAYTPRGKNHGWDLYEYALKNPDKWYASLLTIRDTRKPDGSPIIEEAYLDTLRAQGQDEDLLQQEYYCSFEGSVQGSYYGRYLAMARTDKPSRVGFYPWVPNKMVRTAWDIGKNDTTDIWFYQKIGPEIRLIDFHENYGHGPDYYAKYCQEKPYTYDLHLLPHDADYETIAANKTFHAQLLGLGLRNIRVVKRALIETGITAVRRLFPRFRFNEGPCEEGLKALSFYHKKWDEKKQAHLNHPEHDWSSNAADGLRTLAMGENDTLPEDVSLQIQAEGRWDPYAPENMSAQYEHDPFAPAMNEQSMEGWR